MGTTTTEDSYFINSIMSKWQSGIRDLYNLCETESTNIPLAMGYESRGDSLSPTEPYCGRSPLKVRGLPRSEALSLSSAKTPRDAPRVRCSTILCLVSSGSRVRCDAHVPSHYGRGGHTPSATFTLIIFIAIGFVHDFLSNDFLPGGQNT